jgi:putative ABC transport system permease protein
MTTALLSALRLAFVAIARNKLRTGLTMLGILIGVAAVVVTIALGAGARAQINSQIDSLGSNILLVFAQSNQASGARGAQGNAWLRLSEDDAKAIVRGATSIAGAAPYLRTNAQILSEGSNANSQILGTTLSYFSVRQWPIKSGALWEEPSELSGERVCVVGTTVAESLFGKADPVGRIVRIGRAPFRLIGVLASKGLSPFGNDQDDIVMMPASTFRAHLLFMPRKSVHGIVFTATSAQTSDRARTQADAILRERHHIVEGREPDFTIRTQDEIRASQEAIYGTISMTLLAVGGVSLLIGGIGIMNIMLVSIAERTREIGIRMAVGARERNIMMEFLIEAILLALVGGALGAGLALGIITVVAQLSSWPMRIDPFVLLVALGTSSAIGVVFGFFPAQRAARLDPVHALYHA